MVLSPRVEIVIDNVSLLKVTESLVSFVPFEVELAHVHVNMRCLDMM